MQVYQHEIEGAMAKLIERDRMENKARAEARAIAEWHRSRKDQSWADRMTTSKMALRAERKAELDDMIRQALRLRDQAKDAVTRAKFEGEAHRLRSIERAL
jgi:hypothetical protein